MLTRGFRRCFSTVETPAYIDSSRFESEAITALESMLETAETQIHDSVNNLNDGVLKIEHPKGTIIINKHFLTKQLWYSSPVIGPAYFDALTSLGHRWWSIKLQKDVFTQLSLDAKHLSH